jgi:hypothetical protein
LSFLAEIQSGNVFAAMIRGPVAPPWSLSLLVAAGLHGLAPIAPVKSAESLVTGAIAFRARFEYQWTVDDVTNAPIVLAAFLGSPPTKLLFAGAWALPAGYPIAVGDRIAIPIFLSAQED